MLANDLHDPTWDKDDLKARVDLRDIVAEAWGPGKAHGDYVMYHARWRGDDHTPSFAVYENGFKDFGGSGEAGDVYTWLEREYGLTFGEAVRWLHERVYGANAAPLMPRRPEATSTARNEPPSAGWQRAARAALERAQAYLWSKTPEAAKVRAYLHEARGLTDETIRSYGLGYNPDWQRTAYRYWSEQYKRKRRARLAPGIVIPWYRNDALVALRVRCRVGALASWLKRAPDTLKGQELDKYRSYRGSKLAGRLYNGDALRPGGDVLIVEGEFDAMLAAQQLGERVTVVTLGSATNRLSRRLRDQLREQRRVYTALDNDEAGAEATARLARVLDERHIPLALPEGKDITEYVVEHGGDLVGWFAVASGRLI